jgi:surface antigen bspA-like
LTEVTLPSLLQHIEGAVFWQCRSLKQITLPSQLQSIGSGVFAGCSSLTSLTFPASVHQIGESLFNGCDHLEHLTCLSPNPPSFSEDTTDPLKYYRQLTVPSGSKASYEAITGWKRCNPIVEAQ